MLLMSALNALLMHLRKKGYSDVPILYGDYSYDSGRQAFQQWMKDNEAPTAVVCSNDIMAIGVIDEARSNWGLKVPEDLSVVRF